MDPNYQGDLPKCSLIGDKPVTKEALKKDKSNDEPHHSEFYGNEYDSTVYHEFGIDEPEPPTAA